MKNTHLTLQHSLMLCIILLFSTLTAQTQYSLPNKGFTNSYLSTELKIDSLISLMTIEEKVNMLYGNGLFTSAGAERLGIPELHYTDGPFGIREEVSKNSWAPVGLTTDSATFFPTGSALAATWNPDLAFSYGIGIGEEARTRGKNILLGPGVNISRTPLCGRTFEYFSEDPFLNSRLTVGYIKGVQQTGVAACVKHYAANNQETRRGDINVEMDERTLREIYLPAFKAAVEEAHVYTVMAAYNKLRGSYCAENNYLLNDILKKEWGFQGFVMSDWSGTHSTVNSALHGLDVEMGTKKYFSQPLLDAVKKGQVPVSAIDDKVRRILRVSFFTNSTPFPPSNGLVSIPEHGKIVYNIALQSIVLLKNQTSLLPIDLKKTKHIVVIGDNATHKHASGGFGAGVKTRYEITPLQGLQTRLKDKASITFVQGYRPKFNEKKDSRFRTISNQPDQELIKEAVAAARKADVAIVFVGTNHDVETEALDRTTLLLPFGQDELIKAVSAVNKKTIVVVVAAAPVDLNVTDKAVSSIVWAWYNGSEGGNALADILLGNANPSGKLPLTIPVSLNDSPAHYLKAFPGDSTVNYAEGILVGYRWFDTKKIKPLYGFGYGLSYTKFAYSGVKANKTSYNYADDIEVTVNVKNTGSKDGMETVQLYVSDEAPQVMKASKELKAFAKVLIVAGQEKEVKLKLKVSDLAYFDDKQMKWIVTPGSYKLQVGTSSQEILASTGIVIE